MPPQFYEIQIRLDGKKDIIKTTICFACMKAWITSHHELQKYEKCGSFDALNYQCLICQQVNLVDSQNIVFHAMRSSAKPATLEVARNTN